MFSPAIPSVPPLLGSGYATVEGSPDVGMESYLHPVIAVDSITGVPSRKSPPPQAEPSLITERDGEGPAGRYEGSDPFEFVSPSSITTGQWGKI